MNKERLINTLLVLGVFIGISLALFSSIRDTNFNDSRDWVARVEGAEISKEKYLLQLEGLNSDKRVPLNKEDKAFVLERMIEEELLIQRAKDLGLFSTNTMIRGAIVQQMINMVISENSLDIVSNAELKSFYEENKGKNEDQINTEGDKSALEIPDTLMTLAKVREYIGPSLMQVAKMLQPGEFTAPKKVIGGYKIIILLERRDASPPQFEFIRERVKSEYQKRKDDQALRDYLNKLKKSYEIDRNSEI